tara:strand:+ start:337 stop:930 length:594 start_codon:yes stop_codon:yes gene_type:complete
MDNNDLTETYLNLNSDQFNSWIKDFEEKYKKIESSNFNNVETFTNSEVVFENNSELLEEDSEEEESESIFVKNQNDDTESSNKSKKLIFNKYKTSRISKSSEITTPDIKTKSSNKQKLNLSESSISEKNISSNLNLNKEEEIINLTTLNLMIPDKIENSKSNHQDKDLFQQDFKKPKESKTKLGDKALFKFISNRRR